jgi:dihydroorotate dehydrogenase electron transfer subunit
MLTMDDREGTLLDNSHIVSNNYLVRIKLSQPMTRVVPGQFVMVRLPSEQVFLRRPFSIYSYRNGIVGILYRVVGKGTDYLSSMTTGEKVMLLGPLGRPFHVKKDLKTVLVAGGIGIAGINLLWTRLKEKSLLFYGCCKGEETALLRDMEGFSPYIATEDGSVGFKGLVTDLLSAHLNQLSGKAQIFACGPEGMYREIKTVLEGKGIACQVLVEERMACGLGLCFGCVKKTVDEKEPYKRACLEGPVFDLWQICL